MLRAVLALLLSLAAAEAWAQTAALPLTNMRAVRVAVGVNGKQPARDACGVTAEVEGRVLDALRAGVEKAGPRPAPGRNTATVQPGFTIHMPQPNDTAVPILFMLITLQAVQAETEIVCSASILADLRTAVAGARVVATNQTLDTQMITLWVHDAAYLGGTANFPEKLESIGTAVAATFGTVWTKANPAPAR